MSLNVEMLQTEYVNKADKSEMNPDIGILSDLKGTPLDSQMREAAGFGYNSDTVFLEEYMGYYNNKENVIFILSNNDILDQMMFNEIKKEFPEESSLSIRKIADLSGINHSLRGNPIEIEFEDRLLKCYVGSKAYHQDALDVFFTVEPLEQKLENKPRRMRP